MVIAQAASFLVLNSALDKISMSTGKIFESEIQGNIFYLCMNGIRFGSDQDVPSCMYKKKENYGKHQMYIFENLRFSPLYMPFDNYPH